MMMAAKTTNVLVRAEPDIIKQAEAIMAQLGLPASVVSNILYNTTIAFSRYMIQNGTLMERL